MTNNLSAGNNGKLYALIVGITDYASHIPLDGNRVAFPKLSGCISDAEKMMRYLEKDSYYDVDIKFLANQAASKQGIVDAFQEHFSQATENDVVLFYFSGHGAQEYVDNLVFPSETDGKSESIACYYDESNKDNFLLSDKEIRWLINEVGVKSPHIITIFDCCHSSGVTRASMVAEAFGHAVTKGGLYVFKQRPWDNYLFRHFSQAEFLEYGESKLLPETAHIEMCACESNEPALEVNGEGVFTQALLKVLDSSNGQVSYQTIYDRVRQLLRGIYEQKPFVTSVNGAQNSMQTGFLRKPVFTGGESGEVIYNAQLGWVLNVGAIHGLSAADSDIQLVLYDEANPGQKYNAKVALVNTDSSILSIGDSILDTDKVYKAELKGLLSVKLSVHVAPNAALLQDQQVLMNKVITDAVDFVSFVDDENVSDYVIRFNNDYYYITKPHDPYRPLGQFIHIGPGDKWADDIIRQFKHISCWHFIKAIKNQHEATLLPENVLSIGGVVGLTENELTAVKSQDKITVKLTNQDGKWSNKVKIELSNTSEADLYVSVVYLASDFMAFTGFLPIAVYHLEPGEKVRLGIGGKKELEVAMPEMMRWYNVEKLEDHLKFIVSTDQFDVSRFSLNSLPEPPAPMAQDVLMDPKMRGVNRQAAIQFRSAFEVTVPQPAVKGWRVYDVEVDIVNPLFNTINQENLERMLADDVTGEFAVGLYYNIGFDENGATSYTLKPEITVTAQEKAVRGLISDIGLDLANWYARRKRNRYYQSVTKRDPNRLRIVSEGDSWFQHPLVRDIIDHLSKVYAIYCTAAAGDTLSNYLSQDKKQGEYFLDALVEYSPGYFLISGGGNDILGAQFRQFLIDVVNDETKADKRPGKYLKDSFQNKLDGLMEIYKALFMLLKTTQPALQVIVHGYDYPIKLNDPKHGWLGRYMIEKGIADPEDRRLTIRYIMDEFNRKLIDVCKEFENVHYLDVRNIVLYNEADKIDQWYDEIHPNGEGFQQIAMRFIQLISKLEEEKKVVKAELVQ
ncbi:caspase family protein [[Flexibacter] sp. ATCC 35208]|uniref:caspase family protein n=1 Tax=[Flexibacter] sp. ATCC 35208 TaxID=1936242 RepID=UPI0009CF1C08|nr:caspase family protein [[Flexibacter] sp. ATCC 35208]OMP75139.1 hypothetical protein BW716_31750 [[Flexibacter] sp. ATCC 35208]